MRIEYFRLAGLRPLSMPDTAAVAGKRFVAAVCISLFLHALLLTGYEPPGPAENEPRTQTASWRLNLSLRPALTPQPAPEEIKVDKIPLKAKALPADTISAGNAGASDASDFTASPSQIFTSPAHAGDSESAAYSPPRVDLDAAYQFARRMARAQGQNPAQKLHRPAPLTDDSPLGRAIARSVRSDCRTAYAGAGLFAIPSLILDAVTDNGCRW